jgi:hypothetical protein
MLILDLNAHPCNLQGWVEATPQHIMHLPDIFAADPSARVVVMMRDGRDVVASGRQLRQPLHEALNKRVCRCWHSLVPLPMLPLQSFRTTSRMPTG